jgi:hypothetical protein
MIVATVMLGIGLASWLFVESRDEEIDYDEVGAEMVRREIESQELEEWEEAIS